MTVMQHNRWNIEWDAISLEQAHRMPADVVCEEINYLRRRLAEVEFLLACHGEGIVMPEPLRTAWPENDYRQEGEQP